MITQAKLKSIIKEKSNLIQYYLKKFCELNEQEYLHEFRVEIKKFECLILFISLCSKNKKIKSEYLPIKKIFKYAGRIRSDHLILDIINKYTKPDENLTQLLRKNVLSRVRNFNKNKIKFPKIIADSAENIKKDLTAIREQDLFDYVDRSIINLILEFNNQIKINKLHQNRKKIKYLIYLNDYFKKSINKRFRLNISFLHELQDKIGKWHDRIIAIEVLKIHGLLNNEIFNLIQHENETLLNSIIDLSKNFDSNILLNS